MTRTKLYGAHVLETDRLPDGQYSLDINGQATGRRFETREEAETFGMDEVDRITRLPVN